MSSFQLYKGDCLELLPDIISTHEIHAVIVDPPYGTTKEHWDSPIDLGTMWNELSLLPKPIPVLLFGQEPFSSKLRLSNIKDYRYDIYWEKERITNIMQVKRRPGKVIENISVFYKAQPTYNPQMVQYTGPARTNKIKDGRFGRLVDTRSTKPYNYNDIGLRYPTQHIKFKRDIFKSNLHPTLKPVALLEYLINTFTNPGDTVLDFCAGSGSTGIACLNTGRNFIGIELDDHYFTVMEDRLNNHKI